MSDDFGTEETTAACADFLVGDAGIELMAIAACHPFKTNAPDALPAAKSRSRSDSPREQGTRRSQTWFGVPDFVRFAGRM